MEENDNTPVDETTNDALEATAEIAADEPTAELESAGEGTTDVVAGSTVHSKRQEKIGLVTSNKMTKTVVVRVERQVRHPKYKRYIRRRKKFMAHDDLGVNIGDIVKIIETRPMSARKRWRVVEVIQKAS